MSMRLDIAQRWAAAVVAELAERCERIEIAGSIRRGCQVCGDIDIVCIPKTKTDTDLLGAVTGESNRVVAWAMDYVDRSGSKVPRPGEETARIVAGGKAGCKQLIVQLRRCQLDLWFASASNFASRLLTRTGSKAHNRWLALRLAERGMHWFPYEGIATTASLREANIQVGAMGAAEEAVAAKLILAAGTEADLYGYAGLEMIAPENREEGWLAGHIDSGL